MRPYGRISHACWLALALILTGVGAAGCSSQPQIDASSEAVAASIERVRESLPERDRLRFDVGLYNVTLARTFGALDDTAAVPDAVSLTWIVEPLDGLTGDQVIAKGDCVRLEMEQREEEN